VKGFLKRFIHDLQERQIHVDVGRGFIRIDDAELELAPLLQVLDGILPAGWELRQARATGIQLDIPWKQLRQRSTVVSVASVTLCIVQHRCEACGGGGGSGRDTGRCEYWAATVERRRGSELEVYRNAKHGSVDEGLVQTITSGLQLSIDALDLHIERCPASTADGGKAPSPIFSIHIEDMFWGPIDPRLKRMTLYAAAARTASTSKELRLGSLSLATAGGGGNGAALEPMLKPVPVTLRLWSTLPSDGHTVCPFATSVRLEAEVHGICIDGKEAQVRSLLGVAADIMAADALLQRELGPWQWSNAHHEARLSALGPKCSPVAQHSPTASEHATPSVASRSPLASPLASPRSSGEGKKKKSTSKRLFGWLSGKNNKKGGSAEQSQQQQQHHQASGVSENKGDNSDRSAATSGTAGTFGEEGEEEESADSDGTNDTASLAGEHADLERMFQSEATAPAFFTPMHAQDQGREDPSKLLEALDAGEPPDLSRNVSFKSFGGGQSEQGEEAPRRRAVPGRVRQVTLTIEISTIRLGIFAPRCQLPVQIEICGLGYQRLNCAWLMEAQQACAERFKGSFGAATSSDPSSRGADSQDGTLFSEHHVSVRTCRIAAPAALARAEADADIPDDGRGPQLTLLEPTDSKEETIQAVWRSTSGEPCVGRCGVHGLSVWPLEVALRGMSVRYEPALWRWLVQMGEPFYCAKPEEDDPTSFHSSNEDSRPATPKKSVSEARLAARASCNVVRAKIIAFRNIDLIQPSDNSEDALPHRLKIQSAVLENVAADFSSIAPLFGLAQPGAGDAGRSEGERPDVDGMDVEQLRAEVMMWRLKQGR